MREGSVLLAASTDKGRALLQSLISPDQYETIRTVQSAAEAMREAQLLQPALIIINTPLTDESGMDLACELIAHTDASVLLLVKAELAELVASKVEEAGVLVIPKPVSRLLFDQAVRFAASSRRRLLILHQEIDKLQKKMNELKQIDRAKCALIQYLGMTEEQAHRYIEKQAMDKRMTRVAVAQNVLAVYEL